jgi:hypothetical protein
MPSVEVFYNTTITLNFSVDEAFFPKKINRKEMLSKVEGILRYSPHDLRVINTTSAL